MDAKKAEKVTALTDESLEGIGGGLRSMDWRTCPKCGYKGGGWSYTDMNKNLKCPACGEKQAPW